MVQKKKNAVSKRWIEEKRLYLTNFSYEVLFDEKKKLMWHELSEI